MPKYLADNIQVQDDQENLVPTYDILNCGKRHRFWANGKLVHNSANMQNLPSGRGEGQSDLLRRSIIAPDGYVCVNYDASQIEARVLAYVAGQHDVLNVFANNGDVYSYAAAGLYGIPYDEIIAGRKSDDHETAAKYNAMRQYGKTATLALGYNQGAQGFKRYAFITAGLSMTEAEAKEITTKWRKNNQQIANFWRICDQALQVMAAGGEMYFGGGDGRLFYATGNRVVLGKPCAGIRLPNGLWLNYPNLRTELRDGRPSYCYDKGSYRGAPSTTWTYGGAITENLVQALAFAVMKYQALLINSRYPVKMNTHDEWTVVVPVQQAEDAAAFMAQCMTTPPQWLAGIPLATEGGWAQSYGAVDDNWADATDNPNREYRVYF